MDANGHISDLKKPPVGWFLFLACAISLYVHTVLKKI